MKVLKFGAEWCSDCIIMKPVWKELEAEFTWLETRYFDYDNEKAAVVQYSAGPEIPCFIFLDKNDREIARFSGDVPKKTLSEAITKYKDY